MRTTAEVRSHPGPRPRHLHLPSVALVVVGGVLGVASREGLVLALPAVEQVPVATWVVNLLGAFILGLLYEALTRTETPGRLAERARLLVGTGFCGGLTTYSALAMDTAILLDGARPGAAALYAVSTVAVGALATFLGIVTATTVVRRRRPAPGDAR